MLTEALPEPSQTSKMELFAKIKISFTSFDWVLNTTLAYIKEMYSQPVKVNFL